MNRNEILRAIREGKLVLDRSKTPLSDKYVKINRDANIRNNIHYSLCTDCEFGDYTSKGMICSKKNITFKNWRDSPLECNKRELDSFMYDLEKAVFK